MLQIARRQQEEPEKSDLQSSSFFLDILADIAPRNGSLSVSNHHNILHLIADHRRTHSRLHYSFRPAPSCSTSSLLTTTVSYYSAYGTSTSSTRLLPDTSDPRYTACLAPAGSQFSFSPAVCPQGWPAWWLGKTTPALSGAATAPSAVGSVSYVSTAYCCAPGYSMLRPDTEDDPSPSCEQAFTSTTSSSGHSFVSTTTLSKAMVPAWHISWQTTDMPTLSPRPPALDDGGETITRWVPGSDPEREQPRDDSWGGGIGRSLFFFLVVGIPLIIVAAIAACLVPARAAGVERKHARAQMVLHREVTFARGYETETWLFDSRVSSSPM